MSVSAENLSPNQAKALSALLTHLSIAEAASACGLNERTVRRYLEDATFSAEYLRARRLLVSQTTGQLQAATGEAVGALRAVMEDQAAPASARVAAARVVLELSYKGVEVEDLARRVEALEQTGTVNGRGFAT